MNAPVNGLPTIAICGIRFLYKDTLNREWAIFGIVRPAPEKKLPSPFL